MTSFDLEWTSTPGERYDTDMNERARQIALPLVVLAYGGSDGRTADNGLSVHSSLEEAEQVAQKVATEVGHDVNLIDATDNSLVATYLPQGGKP